MKRVMFCVLIAILFLGPLTLDKQALAAEILGSNGLDTILLSDGRLVRVNIGLSGCPTLAVVATCPFPVAVADSPYQVLSHWGGGEFALISRTGRYYADQLGYWYDCGYIFETPTAQTDKTWGEIKAIYR